MATLTRNDLRYVICPRCKGSGREMIFGYLQNDAQLIPNEITCRVCKGSGIIIRRVKGGIK